jgi:hypothetical protein
LKLVASLVPKEDAMDLNISVRTIVRRSSQRRLPRDGTGSEPESVAIKYEPTG